MVNSCRTEACDWSAEASLTDAGVPAAARFSTRHITEEDLELRVEQRHVFTSEDLRHTAHGQVKTATAHNALLHCGGEYMQELYTGLLHEINSSDKNQKALLYFDFPHCP